MEKVYATQNGKVCQSDEMHCFFLEFRDKKIKIAPCSLIALRSKLNDLNLEYLLLDEDYESNIEIVPICNREHFLVLSLIDLIELKELISGTFVMLELNSIVNTVKV